MQDQLNDVSFFASIFDIADYKHLFKTSSTQLKIFDCFYFTDSPLNDYPIFTKREIDFARQIVEKPEGSELVLLNKILNGATRADKGGLALDLNLLKEIMNDLDIDSIPELENLLSQERKLLSNHIRTAKNSYRPSNSLYANHILAMP